MSSKYEFIDGEKAWYPVVAMCRWAQVSRSGFYVSTRVCDKTGRPMNAERQPNA